MFGALVVGLLVSAFAAGAIVIVKAWFRSRAARAREVPPLFVIPHSTTRVEPMIGFDTLSPVRPSPARAANGVRPPRSPGRMAGSEALAFDDARFADVDAVPVRGANSETVRFLRPGEEQIQILPGRLEVLAGEPKHREIRFVRSPGEPAELILGRDPGPSPHAIALQSDTVSRRHARFAFSNGRWSVTNLSRTNPVVVNDERLFDNSIERPLADGDRVELGEVVLRFRAR
jgi:FHA domain